MNPLIVHVILRLDATDASAKAISTETGVAEIKSISFNVELDFAAVLALLSVFEESRDVPGFDCDPRSSLTLFSLSPSSFEPQHSKIGDNPGHAQQTAVAIKQERM